MNAKSGLYLAFVLALSFVCYRHPMAEDFDRYIYEAIVLGKSRPVEAVYPLVKHESPRAEASSVLDSPQHLKELEPLYAIRPLYIELIAVMARTGLTPQHAINFISAASFAGIGVLLLLWTKNPLLSALLLSTYQVMSLARFGTPDALAALFVLSALWLLEKKRQSLALLLLLVAVGVRTDNILLLLSVLAWLAYEHRLSLPVAGLLSLLGIALVLAIQRWAGNYGWVVLFRFSFIGGKYPALVAHSLNLREYLVAFAQGIYSLLGQVSFWVLAGLVAWKRGREPLLLIVAVAAAAHFVLFPSPEPRYLIWAAIVAGVGLIRSVDGNLGSTGRSVGP